MHIAKGLAIVSVFFVSTCFARITIEAFEPDESGLVEAAIKILESCYGNRVTPLGLAGNLIGTISKKLWSRGSVPVTSIDGTAIVVKNGPVRRKSLHKLQVFVVAASSAITLTRTLREIRASIWWNHMAAFLILDWSPPNNDCSNAFEMLWTTWEMNILNAKLLCHHRTKGRLMIYSFNPYTSEAPEPWQRDKTYSGKKDHPWTLFVRDYGETEEVCSELDFEKTIDLGGYEIGVSLTGRTLGNDQIENRGACFNPYECIYCEVLFPALNATAKMLTHSLNDLGYVDAEGNSHGILAEVNNGLTDIGITPRYLTSLLNLTFTFPHMLSEIRSITQYSGYKSQLSKILSVIDSDSRIGLYLIWLITVLFFKYFLRQPAVIACLNTLRITCNGSLPTIPDKVAPRIYLGSLFLVALTLQGIYQGQLSSLLTKEEPLRNVNTMRDLVELDHTIYGFPTYRLYFDIPGFEERWVGIKEITCTEYVLRQSRAACVGDKNIIMYDAASFKLHMSRGILAPVYVAFPIRPDWPLEQRVNKILQRSVEAHRIPYMIKNVTYKIDRLLEFQENEYKDQGVKILAFEELSFAFAILGIGLGCATISFIIEVSFGRARSRIVRALRRFHYKNK